MLKDVVAWLQGIDLWLIDLGVFVTPLTIFILLLFGCLTWPQVWSHIRRYDRFRKEFEKRFDLIEHQQSRQDFAWFLESEYRKSSLYENGTSLAYRIRNLQFPNEYPPKPGESLQAFARGKMNFDRSEDNDLWEFFKDAFRKMFEIYDAVWEPPGTLRTFFNSRRITSKFWDDAARNIIEKRLRSSDIERQLDTNFTLIRALAISEFAMACEFTWDEGRGKTSLFIAALGLDHLNDPKWREYLR